LAWYDRDGKELGTVGEPETNMGNPALSPDGHRIAWPVTEANNRDIWILDTRRGTRTRLTFDPGGDDGPSWFPSGDRVAYNALPVGGVVPGGLVVLARAADGTGAVDTLGKGVGPNVAPDGGHAVYTGFEKGGTVWSVMEVPLQGPRTPRTLVTGNPYAGNGRISPSGNFLAYMSNESGQWEVYLTRYPSCEGRWQVSTAGGQHPRWAARGDRLCFTQVDDVMEVEVSGAAEPVLGTPGRLFTRPALGQGGFGFYTGFDMTGDGARFLITRPAGQQGPAQGVAVVQNWTAEFTKKR
jgi:serine/threonine-protein kinase